MSAQLKILSPGLMSSIQDKGRLGYGSSGVPRSGAIDLAALRMGNALVGNDPYEAAIEFRILGPTVVAENGPVRIGLACQAKAEVTSDHDKNVQLIQPWQTLTLHPGDMLKVSALSEGASGYLTIEGGMALKSELGSLSTYALASIGALCGENLKESDVIPVRSSARSLSCERILSLPEFEPVAYLRVIPGPQDDFYATEELERFLSTTYTVSSESNRMGIRLEGTMINALPEKGSDLISDGLVAGSIQIPGNGLPIILGVDCQTVGGYPKIATVISADLHKLGQLKPGDSFQFKSVTLSEAQVALKTFEQGFERTVKSIKDFYGAGTLDLKALYESNLIDGVVDASNPANFPGHLEEGYE